MGMLDGYGTAWKLFKGFVKYYKICQTLKGLYGNLEDFWIMYIQYFWIMHGLLVWSLLHLLATMQVWKPQSFEKVLNKWLFTCKTKMVLAAMLS